MPSSTHLVIQFLNNPSTVSLIYLYICSCILPSTLSIIHPSTLSFTHLQFVSSIHPPFWSSVFLILPPNISLTHHRLHHAYSRIVPLSLTNSYTAFLSLTHLFKHRPCGILRLYSVKQTQIYQSINQQSPLSNLFYLICLLHTTFPLLTRKPYLTHSYNLSRI